MHIARDWRLKKQRLALVGEVCENCGTKRFTPRGECPVCAKEALSSVTVMAEPVAAIRRKQGALVTA